MNACGGRHAPQETVTPQLPRDQRYVPRRGAGYGSSSSELVVHASRTRGPLHEARAQPMQLRLAIQHPVMRSAEAARFEGDRYHWTGSDLYTQPPDQGWYQATSTIALTEPKLG